ncbi:MAG: hypothetical protein SGCHY_002349 [Lobulomycetales sp.]
MQYKSSPHPGTVFIRHFSARPGRNLIPKTGQEEPDLLDEFQVEWRHYPIILILIATATFVLAYDFYYLVVLEEKLEPLDDSKFAEYELQTIIPVTPTTSLFRFRADIPDHMNLPMPSHVVLKDDSCQVGRSYTPISYGRQFFDLLVKRYDDGLVSRFVHSLEPGRKVEMRGPILTFPYERNMAPEIGMIAGGTGIAPMYQLIKHILRDPDDCTQISLVYANKTQQEILLRRELDILVSQHPDRLKVFYTLDSVEEKGWTGGRGFIDKKMIRENIPSADKEGGALVLVCGPDPMVRHVAGNKLAENRQGPIGGLLKELSFSPQQVFKF